MFSACKAHAPYYTVLFCGLSGCTIFCHIRKDAVFGETKLLNIKCVFGFSIQSLCETFHILTIIKRDISINVRQSSCKVPANFVRD